MIAGIGVDVCEVARIRRALEGRAGARFRERVFTAGEQAYCEARKRARYQSYAARFAAKEAAMKVLGSGWAQGVRWCDVEVVRGDEGPPVLCLAGEAAAIAVRLGITQWHVTLSHTARTAVACAVAESLTASGRSEVSARRAAGARSTARPPTGRR